METMRRFSRRTFVRLGRRRERRLLSVRPDSGDERAGRARADPRRHARSERCAQVRHSDAGAAGNAPGGDDHAARRQDLDYYEISMKQFAQQILPAGLPATTVWGYGATAAESDRGLLLHNAPSLTIEAQWNRPVRVKWINELVDGSGNYLPHLLPVDPTLHWANPPGGTPVATRGRTQPVDPCPAATSARCRSSRTCTARLAWATKATAMRKPGTCPRRTTSRPATRPEGTWYDFFAGKAAGAYGVAWGRGFATFQYPNENRASTIWYHDHALGMTRLNVYAGPAGFYLVRGGRPATMRFSTAGPASRRRFPALRRGRTTSSRPTSPTERSRSRFRIARSTLTGRSSTPTRASSSTGSSVTSSRTGSSPRSGTPSSSAT